jgi:predicted transcriptional regulator
MPRRRDPVQKVSTSVRLTQEGKRLLDALAEKLGISQSAALEIAIREKARKEKVVGEG